MRKVLYFIVLTMLLYSVTNRSRHTNHSPLKTLEYAQCVLDESFQQSIAMEQQDKYGYKLLSLPSATDCMLAMRTYKADVVFGAEMYSFNSAFHRSHLKVSHIFWFREEYFPKMS